MYFLHLSTLDAMHHDTARVAVSSGFNRGFNTHLYERCVVYSAKFNSCEIECLLTQKLP